MFYGPGYLRSRCMNGPQFASPFVLLGGVPLAAPAQPFLAGFPSWVSFGWVSARCSSLKKLQLSPHLPLCNIKGDGRPLVNSTLLPHPSSALRSVQTYIPVLSHSESLQLCNTSRLRSDCHCFPPTHALANMLFPTVSLSAAIFAGLTVAQFNGLPTCAVSLFMLPNTRGIIRLLTCFTWP